MNNIKKIVWFIVALPIIGIISSCDDFLDVDPVSYTHLTLPTS